MAEENTNEEELRKRAEKMVEEREGLLWHIASYVIVNLLVWGIWLILALSGSSWYPWPVWVTLPWGVGLAFHVVGFFIGRRSEVRREEQIQREMERLRKQ